MDLSGRLFLAVIEEDNTQRVLFRVRPLLGEDGPIQQEELEAFGDDGYLRVVPDRHEQHTFKERMRELGTLCLINLKDTPPGLDKVRPNKNYAPLKGERNRFVIYSDAVNSLSSQTMYEVVADGRAATAGTAAYYLRKGGHIQGPYDQGTGEPVDALSCIAPDNNRLYAVSMPDGRERLFYWPQTALIEISYEAEQDVPQAEEAVEEESALPPQEPAVEAPQRSARMKRAVEALSQAVDRGLRRQRVAEPTEQPEQSPEVEPEQDFSPEDETQKPSRPYNAYEEAVDRLHETMSHAGYALERDSVANLLLRLLLFPGVGVTARYLPDARLAVRLMKQALSGAQPSGGQQGYAKVTAGQDAAPAPVPNDDPAAYWPEIHLDVRAGFDGALPDAPGAVFDAGQLRAEISAAMANVPQEALTLLEDAERTLSDAGHPLPLTLKHDLLRYLRIAPALLPGGINTAMDYVMCCQVIPFARRQGADVSLLRPLCTNMPLALALL